MLDPRPDPRRRAGATSAFEASKLKVAVVVPMTSRGTDMSSVDQSPLWFNLFASFVESVDWRKNKHQFVFYLGFAGVLFSIVASFIIPLVMGQSLTLFTYAASSYALMILAAIFDACAVNLLTLAF